MLVWPRSLAFLFLCHHQHSRRPTTITTTTKRRRMGIVGRMGTISPEPAVVVDNNNSGHVCLFFSFKIKLLINIYSTTTNRSPHLTPPPPRATSPVPQRP